MRREGGGADKNKQIRILKINYFFSGYGAYYRDCFNKDPSFDNFNSPALANQFRILYGDPDLDTDQE